MNDCKINVLAAFRKSPEICKCKQSLQISQIWPKSKDGKGSMGAVNEVYIVNFVYVINDGEMIESGEGIKKAD